MGILDVSFGVLKINDFSRFFNKQLLCSTSTQIHIKKSIEPQITANNGISVSPSIVGTFFFFYYDRHLMVSGPSLSFDDSKVVFITLFLKSCGTQVHLLGVAYSWPLGSINFVERRFPRGYQILH
jgi:hypothetical protein